MITTANMGLLEWNGLKDNFDHDQLIGNWSLIDQHDHSNNRGVQISTPGIAPQAVTSSLIAPEAVGADQIAPNAVHTVHINGGAITNPLLAAGSVFGNAIAASAITEDKLDPSVLPVGTVTLWYRGPNSNTTPPGGWEIMDGRAWSGIPNSLGLSTGTIPDMRNVFVRGADLTGVHGPLIGATGGSSTANLAHAHNVASHQHNIGPHQHEIIGDGDHFHHWNNGLDLWTRTNSFAIGLTINDHSGAQRQNTFYSMYVKNSGYPGFDQIANMDTDGLHNHGGTTLFNAQFNSGPAGSVTDSQLGSVAITPQYVGLLFIMLVR